MSTQFGLPSIAGLGEIMIDVVTVLKTLKAGYDTLKDSFPKGGPSAAISWLLQGSSLSLRILTVIFLILSALLGTKAVVDMLATNDIIARALKSPLEESPHPDTAIASLVLASILPNPSGSPDTSNANGAANGQVVQVKDAKFTSPFLAEIEDFQKQLTAEVAKAKPDTGSQKQVPEGSSQSPITLNILPGDKGESLSSKILTDGENGFLFVRGTILDSKPDPKAASILLNRSDNPPVFLDILLSEKMADNLCGILSGKYGQPASSVFEKAPTVIEKRFRQAYLIFNSGITRLCETDHTSDATSQRTYYGDIFPSDTYLNQRPYFAEAIKQENQSGYWTTPYIDLGGHGVVQTFCHGMTADDEDVVLCFDFVSTEPIEANIRSLVARYGGTTTSFYCASGTCTPAPKGLSEEISNIFRTTLTPKDMQNLEDKYTHSADRNSKAMFNGTINLIRDEADPADDFLLFPIRTNNILAIKLDLVQYGWWRTFWLCATASCCAATLLLLVLLFVDYGLKFREQERAFNAVDTIMTDVPAPYARVDDDGKFLKINKDFAKLMNYDNVDDAIAHLKDWTYEDFLDEPGKLEYEKIKEERKKGMPYRSYKVYLYTGGPGKGPQVWVKVHGDDVPTPHLPRGKPGQSFGILLRTDPPKLFAVPDAEEEEIKDTAASG